MRIVTDPAPWRLRQWLSDQGLKHGDFAAKCKIDRSLLSHYLSGNRKPSPHHRAVIERETGGAFQAAVWDETPTKATHDDAPPASEQRPRELGSTHEELRATIQEIDAVRRKGGLTPNQDAALLGKRASTLSALARLEDRTALEDHPGFDALLDDLLLALDRTLDDLGVTTAGTRTRFAEHLERIDAERQRRAA